MLVKPDFVRFGYYHKAAATYYLTDPAGTYSFAGTRAATIGSAGAAYVDPAVNAHRPATAEPHFHVTRAIAGWAKIVEGADGETLDSLAGAGDLTIDGSSVSNVSGVGAAIVAAVGTYIPVSGPVSTAPEDVNPVRAYSLARPSAPVTGPAGASSVARAATVVKAGTDIPVNGSTLAAVADSSDAPGAAGESAATSVPDATDGAVSAGAPAADEAGSASVLSISPDGITPHGAPAGYYYQAGATAYIEDPPGTWSHAGQTTPTADPGGTFSGPGASAPTPDQPGTYSSPYALDRLFLETSSATPNNRVLTFKTLTGVENYYGATSDEAALASQFFTTYGSSAEMLFIRFPLGGNRAHLYGGREVSKLTTAQFQAIKGTLKVTSQGRHYSAKINLKGVTSPTLAATEIQAALNEKLPVAAVTTGDSIKSVSVNFTASVNGLLLDVTSIAPGQSIEIGAMVSGAKIPAGTQIVSQFTGAPGGVGLYSLYVPGGIIPTAETLTESYGVLTVGSVVSGRVADGEQVTDTSGNVLPDTAIQSNLGGGAGAGSQWIVNLAQTVASENMTMTGAPLSVLYTAITGATKNSGYFSIQQNGYFNWNTASLTYASGTAAAALGLAKAAGAWLNPTGENITSEATFMNMVEALDPDFGSFQATWPQLAQEDPEAQAALAAWAASTNGQHQFLENDTSTTTPAGASAATPAQPGYYVGITGASTETPAAVGTFISATGATSAAAEQTDPIGTFSGPGASAATPAQPGYYVGTTGASTETPAAAGTYIPFSGATSALQATPDPAGYYCPAGASAPTIDPAGYYSGAGAAAPTPASAGTYIPFTGATSAAQATTDQPGYYSLAGASAPTEAQPGYYVKYPDASSETKDDPGCYTPLPGATAELKAHSPTISGAVSGQTISPLETDRPFSSVTISDPNQYTTDTLTILMTGGTGTLTDGAGFDGLTMTAPGVYVLAGTAAEITSELGALVFTPSAGRGTRTFTLTDVSSAGTSWRNTKTTVKVDSNPPPVVVSVPYFLAHQSSLDQNPRRFDILADASLITANLHKLDDPHIKSIVILDNNQGAPSVKQLTSDATAIGKLKNADSSRVLLAVHDTAADVENGLSTLVADTGEIASITAKGRVSVSASTFLADRSTLNKIIGGFEISGTAADVAKNLNALSKDTNVTSITLTNRGVPTLFISLAEALKDTRALDAITTPHMTVIADSAPKTISNIEAIYLSGENIAVDGAPVIATGTIATMAILAQIETSLLESQGYTLEVVDKAANIRTLTQAQINNLAVRGVLKLESNDTSVALSAKLAESLEAAHMTVTAPKGLSVMLKAPKASIENLSATTIAGLPALGVSSIVSTNGAVKIDVAQALALEDAGLKIRGPKGHRVTVTVLDTAANLEGLTARQIDGLTAIGVKGLVSTNANVSYTSAQTAAILKNDINVSATGSHTVTEHATNLKNETFVYGPGFGHDTLIGFLEAGTSHDLLEFRDSMFGFSSGSSQAQDAHELLTKFASGTTNTIITDLQGDTLTINNHSIATFKNHLQDFKFT
jgi:hypothetical protein